MGDWYVVAMFLYVDVIVCVYAANAAMGGNREQRMYLLEIDCAGPMAELLSTSDTRIVMVALEFFQQMANDLEE